MTIEQRTLRILTEHNSDGTHNAAAATTMKTLLPASATPAASTIPIADANGKFPITSAWFYYYESPAQTITSAGALTLAHGLGIIPVHVEVWLKCITAEDGYSIGDMVPVPSCYIGYNGTVNISIGASIVPDATNLNIRFANKGAAGMWFLVNATTGAILQITNANWNVIFRAWA